MVTYRPLHEIVSARDRAEPAWRAESIDEYRELDMLAHAWERGSLKPGAAESAPGRPDTGEDKDSAQR